MSLLHLGRIGRWAEHKIHALANALRIQNFPLPAISDDRILSIAFLLNRSLRLAGGPSISQLPIYRSNMDHFKPFINGVFVNAAGGKPFFSIDPGTKETIATVAQVGDGGSHRRVRICAEMAALAPVHPNQFVSLDCHINDHFHHI